MGLGGGKGRGGGKSGKGGKGGGKSLGSILGNVPIAGGMINGIGSQLPMVGGKFNQGMGQMPGMMGASMGAMNPMMNILNMMTGQGMRGMGQPMFPGMNQMQQGMNASGTLLGDLNVQYDANGRPVDMRPEDGSIYGYADRKRREQQGQQGNIGSQIGGVGGGIGSQISSVGQPQSGGTMPALSGAPSGGGPGFFAQPNRGAGNADFGFNTPRTSQQNFGGFVGTPQAGGDRQSQFFDPRVNR